MGKRKQKTKRRRSASSADLRFTFVLLVLGAILLLFGAVLVGQIRDEAWTGATVSGGVILALVAVTIISIRQRRS
jgi:hypothetical protein